MIRRLSQGLLCLCLLLPGLAYGHELLPGYLELTETSPQVYDVLWKLPLQRGAKLPLAPQFPQGLFPGRQSGDSSGASRPRVSGRTLLPVLAAGPHGQH